MNGVTLVLIGPHSAGKTTLGRRLGAALGWPFDEEIGKRLRFEAIARDPKAHAFVPQPEFDERVIREELERDLMRTGTVRIVETWHPGNLAYAESRSPEVATRRTSLLRRVSRIPGVLVQPLWIHRAAALRRRNELGPAEILDNLRVVAERALAITRMWRLTELPTVWTDRCTPDEAVQDILEAVGRLSASNPPRFGAVQTCYDQDRRFRQV